MLIGKYRVDNLVEANITWVSRGSKEQFHVVSVAKSFNGWMATGTAIRGVNGVLSTRRLRGHGPNHPKREAPFTPMAKARGSQRPRVVANCLTTYICAILPLPDQTSVRKTFLPGVVMAEVELQQIGPYQVTGLHSKSPTSIFYQGKQRKKDILIQRPNIPLSTPEQKECFLSHVKQLKKLKHRNIVNILNADFDGDYGYLVMEYTSSETLSQHLAPGERIATDEAKRYLSPIAGALHYAHMNNIVHANLHPDNLLVGKHNDILLTNFSLTPPNFALSLDDEAFAIPYMAPEHLHGQPTAASDQYSLAVIVYELLCGRRPYQATEQELLLMQQEQIPLPPLSKFNEAISSAVRASNHASTHSRSRETLSPYSGIRRSLFERPDGLPSESYRN